MLSFPIVAVDILIRSPALQADCLPSGPPAKPSRYVSVSRVPRSVPILDVHEYKVTEAWSYEWGIFLLDL